MINYVSPKVVENYVSLEDLFFGYLLLIPDV